MFETCFGASARKFNFSSTTFFYRVHYCCNKTRLKGEKDIARLLKRVTDGL